MSETQLEREYCEWALRQTSPEPPLENPEPPKAEGVETQNALLELQTDELQEIYILAAQLRSELCLFEKGSNLTLLHRIQDDLGRIAFGELRASVGSGNAANPPPGNHPHNPAHECGTCAACGGEMRWNVPRMGSAGGFVHKGTGKFECAERFEYQSKAREIEGSRMGWHPVEKDHKMDTSVNRYRSCVAAAAEDVAGEDWRACADDLRTGCVRDGNGTQIGPVMELINAIAFERAHNSCVSRLQERADRFEKLCKVQHEWGCAGKQFTHIDNVVRLQEQIKTLEVKLETAGDYLVESASRITSLSTRAEEAEAALECLLNTVENMRNPQTINDVALLLLKFKGPIKAAKNVLFKNKVLP